MLIFCNLTFSYSFQWFQGIHSEITANYFWKLSQMDCPSCSCGREQEETFCDRCLTERQTTGLIINYFNRSYPYPAIVGLLLNAGVQISVRTLKWRLRSLGLRRKGQVIDQQYLQEVIIEEMEGARRLSGYRNVWHALRLHWSRGSWEQESETSSSSKIYEWWPKCMVAYRWWEFVFYSLLYFDLWHNADVVTCIDIDKCTHRVPLFMFFIHCLQANTHKLMHTVDKN